MPTAPTGVDVARPRPSPRPDRRARRALHRLLPLAVLLAAGAAQAVDFGLFTLTGFAKGEIGRSSNQCDDCQRFPGENKQRIWADQLVVGAPYKSETKHVTLFQPWLEVHQDLGGGFKVGALASQRWRDGKIDIPGYVYEENAYLSHEDWGSLRVGKMTSRAWSVADYPYGTNVGLADEWASSGAGYGLNTKAARITSRPFDVLEGDLVVEATYDRGNTAFKIHKPRFWEFYAQYHKGDLVIDAVYQDARNGNPQAWGHGPFSGLTPFSQDDAHIGGAGQSIAMVMARYEYDAKWQVSGGVRRNRWSGATAYITQAGPPAQWNSMFNVDWNGTRDGVANPGYSATSTDEFGGLRYRYDAQWSVSTALEHLGTAATSNPSERGQSNAATFGTAGVQYEPSKGLQLYASAGYVHYARLGLSPMSMPTNSAFTGVDSRVTRNGNWFLVGTVYVF
jgi:hypothetical protein